MWMKYGHNSNFRTRFIEIGSLDECVVFDVLEKTLVDRIEQGATRDQEKTILFQKMDQLWIQIHKLRRWMQGMQAESSLKSFWPVFMIKWNRMMKIMEKKKKANWKKKWTWKESWGNGEFHWEKNNNRDSIWRCFVWMLLWI